MTIKVVNTIVTIGTTSTEVLANRETGNTRRTGYTIVPVTSGVTATVARGEAAAVPNEGIPLTQNQPWQENTNEGYPCWQGQVQVVGSATGQVAVSESFEVRN